MMKTKTGKIILQKTMKRSPFKSEIKQSNFKDIIRQSNKSASKQKNPVQSSQPQKPKPKIASPIQSFKQPIQQQQHHYKPREYHLIYQRLQSIKIQPQLKLSEEKEKEQKYQGSLSKQELKAKIKKQEQLIKDKKQLQLQNYRLIEFNFHLNTAINQLFKSTKKDILQSVNQIQKFQYSKAVESLYRNLAQLKKIEEAVKKMSERLNQNHIYKMQIEKLKKFQKKRFLAIQKTVFEIQQKSTRIQPHLQMYERSQYGSSVHQYQGNFPTSLHQIRNTEQFFEHEGGYQYENPQNHQRNTLSYESQHLIQKYKKPISDFTLNKKLFQSDVKNDSSIIKLRNSRNKLDQKDNSSKASLKLKPQIIHHKSNGNQLYRMLVIQAETLQQLF